MSEQPANTGAYMTADDFLNDRRDWLTVQVIETEPECFDIVLKIDGTYFDRDTASEVAKSFAADLRHLVGNLDPSRFLVPPSENRFARRS